ncbi:MAG TPA: SRPBCC domain-containing protein [Rickettsiales bacterium]|nr:SRPBCC domain-containing protein [Rickettsiales bacterium]
MTATNNTSVIADRELVITRIFNAPRTLVFKAWSDPEHKKHWHGPEGFTVTDATANFKPGGSYRACLNAPDGTKHFVCGTYKVIKAPEKLVFTHGWEDENGECPYETLVTITFTDLGEKTRMDFHQAIFQSTESRDGHSMGWNSTFDRLGTYLETL